jgi:nitrogen fixation NifU-like protein
MDDLYRENILQHYKSPHHWGEMADADLEADDLNPLCGDELKVQLKVADGKIEDIRFSGHGCAISQASASILTEEIKGKTLDEVKSIDRQHVLENLGIPISPARVKCALLGLKTLKGAAWGLSEWPGEGVAAGKE